MSCDNKVLIVDDEPSVGHALSVILADAGYHAVLATSGRNAQARADEQTFDVAIIDVGLPDISGLDLLCYLRERNIRMRIIIISAQPTPQIIEEATRLGAVDVLHKPFSPSDILDALGMALSEA
jgi:DNA-binding response OmpR family regulator